jgi:FAD/FMN-containing dehydrogenase
MTKVGIRTIRADKLRQDFGGEVILPADAGYDQARRVWNGMIDRRPAVVVRPRTAADVATAVRFSRDEDLALAVRGGGHSLPGLSTCDDGLVIDLSLMRGVTINPAARTARANGGALLRELDESAQAHGLVCPVGVVGHTGVGGLTLGGGMGRLQRRFGLTVDNLRAVELITADGRNVRASADENADLFWGLRGAGANFGVATAFEFNLHPMAGTITRVAYSYPADRAADVWPAWRDFAATAPREYHVTLNMVRATPAADYPPAIAGLPIVTVGFFCEGDPEAIKAAVDAVRGAVEPAVESVTQMPYLTLQTMFDEAAGWGHRYYAKGGFSDGLPADAWQQLADHMATAGPEDSIALWTQGGAIAETSDDAMAFTGRQALFDVSADTTWEDPSQDGVRFAWVRRAMAIIEPYQVTGGYVNEQSDVGAGLAESIYGGAKYQRLVALKRQWDPDNLFRLNQNIRP